MKCKRRKSGFTLIEVLIVVVIMAVLAATIIPQFTASTGDAQDSAALYNLRTMRGQIQLYRTEHAGNYPTIQDVDGVPSLPQLSSNTNAAGAIGTGGGFLLGPYMTEVPDNPYDNKNYVEEATEWPPTNTTANGGWLYYPTTGQITLNTAGHLND
jgi:prepilin-type N-terminal cleavage/methylation domain-containing protein